MPIHLDSLYREQAKKPLPQFLPESGLAAYFASCCLRVRLLITLHLDSDCNPPESLKELVGTFPTFSLRLPPIKTSLQLLPRKELLYTSCTPSFVAATQGARPSSHLALIANRAWHSQVLQDHVKQKYRFQMGTKHL